MALVPDQPRYQGDQGQPGGTTLQAALERGAAIQISQIPGAWPATGQPEQGSGAFAGVVNDADELAQVTGDVPSQKSCLSETVANAEVFQVVV